MLGAMKYHAAHLFDFHGRDARQTFWYWFLFLFIVNIAVGVVISVPMTMSAMSTAMEATRSGDAQAAQAAMMAKMASSMRPVLIGGIVLGLVNILLLAAAFVRRLHDSGKPGIWAAIAGAIYLFSLWVSWDRADEMVAMMQQLSDASDPQGAIAAQTRMAWQSLLGYIPIVMVIVFGVLKSDPGPNRYGEEPVRF